MNEVRIVRPDGTLRHVLAGGRPTRDDRGRVSGFIGTVLDITERRLAQQTAREKGSLLQTLVDHSSAAIYLKDTAGRYLLVNRRHAELWPTMKDFRVGTTPYEWFSEETARSFIASDAEVWQTGEIKTFEEVIPTAEGSRTYLTVKFPVLSEGGKVVAVGGISADITELEQARRDLAQREQLLRSLIDVQENEKQLLCHEFHDGLIQYAVGSKMLLESLREGELPESCRGGDRLGDRMPGQGHRRRPPRDPGHPSGSPRRPWPAGGARGPGQTTCGRGDRRGVRRRAGVDEIPGAAADNRVSRDPGVAQQRPQAQWQLAGEGGGQADARSRQTDHGGLRPGLRPGGRVGQRFRSGRHPGAGATGRWNCRVESTAGQGTCVQVQLPLRP